MANETFLTASRIRYLLALKQLSVKAGIKNIEVARVLGLTTVSSHNMMDTFLSMNYIEKRQDGRIYLTELGHETASAYEDYCIRLKDKLFSDQSTDQTADRAIYAFLAELSDQSLGVLVQNLGVRSETDVL